MKFFLLIFIWDTLWRLSGPDTQNFLGLPSFKFLFQIFGLHVLLVSQPAQSQSANFGAKSHHPRKPSSQQENLSQVILSAKIQISTIYLSFKTLLLVKQMQ